jgi:hypothetical protein
MTSDRSHLEAYDEPPDVHALDGEIEITGPHVNAAYTVAAAQALACRLFEAATRLEKAADQDRA